MIAALLITLRETLEASLIASIVFGYLKKSHQTHYRPYVWAGIGAAIGVSLLGAWGFSALAGGFEGRAEELFEGMAMLIGAALLTTLIFWMMRQHGRMAVFHNRIAGHVDNARKWELFAVVFFAVLREGIEMVIFLGAAWYAIEAHAILGALLGIGIALIIGYALYKESLRLNMKKFFTYTSVLLILFAAGLVAHGIHEFQEAGVLPTIIEHVWDINPTVTTPDVYPLLHERGAVGALFKGLFGYNGDPSLLEVLGYGIYLALITWLFTKRIRA